MSNHIKVISGPTDKSSNVASNLGKEKYVRLQ